MERLAAEVAAADDLTVEEVLAEAHALLEEDARTEEELLAEARTEAARTPRTAPGSQGVHGL